MEYRDLELTVHGGRDIGPGSSTGQAAEAYAKVSFRGILPGIVRKSDVDREGGRNPIWNLTLAITIQDSSVREPGAVVVVKLYYEGLEGDLFVGEVQIPIPALFDRGIRASAAFNVVPTGSLDISYRFGGKFMMGNQPSFSPWRAIRLSLNLLLTSAFFISLMVRRGPERQDRRGANSRFHKGSSSKAKYSEEVEEKIEAFMKNYRDQIEELKNKAESKGFYLEAEEIQELEEKVKAFAPNYIGYIEEGSYEILPTSEDLEEIQELEEKIEAFVQKYREKMKHETQAESEGIYSETEEIQEVEEKIVAFFRKCREQIENMKYGIQANSEIYTGAKRKDEGASEFRFGIKEMKDSNKRYLEDFILFCSVFPLDYEFRKDVLICQWIAGVLIELEEDEETHEMCAEECFATLMDMNYIIPSGYDYVLDQTRYKISDEMTTFLQNQLLEPKFGKHHDDPTKVELLSLSFKKIDHAVLKQYSCLHTLVIHDCYEVDHLPSDLFSELKALKILNLSRTNIVELPSSVENLKELRFLDMSNTPLVWLPETVCCFTHLQTLRLDGCLQLEGLPEGTSNLINLRHLILDVVRRLESMPVGIGKLSNLRTLSAFLVGEEDGRSVTELKDMNKLRGTFRLLNLENVKTKEEASEACLCKKVDLKKIELQWSDLDQGDTIPPQEEILEYIDQEEEILESLRPGVGIQELKILFYSGGVLPSWICDRSFKELVTIFLYKCRYCVSLPSLGELPSLKHLSIIENKEVVEIDTSFCREQENQYHAAFPKLEKLTFESMSGLERWMISLDIDDFPSLRHLIIEHCPKLVELSYLWCLDSLSHLEIHYCPELSLSPHDRLPLTLQSLMIKESPRLKEWCCDRDWSKIAHVPTVYFDHQIFPLEMELSLE